MAVHKARQRGISMIESLVAILVLAIGVMGLAGLQTRSLVETRLSNARANALLLANDLAERMRLNRDAALGAAPYTLDWTDKPTTANCIGTTAACTAEQLRDFDLAEWRSMVTQLLPGGQARIEAPNNGQIRITFRWRNTAKAEEGSDISDNPLIVPGVDACANLTDWICHQVFVRP